MAGDQLEGPGPRGGAGHQHRELRDVPVRVRAGSVHQEDLVPGVEVVEGGETGGPAVCLDVFLQLSPPPALPAADVTLVGRDPGVNHLVLVQVAFVGEFFPTIIAGKRKYSLVDQLLVLLDVFSILGDLTTDITGEGGEIHRLIGHVDPVGVELVLLQVTFSYTFSTNITEGILGGGGRLPHLIIVFQQGGVVVRVFPPVMRHLLFLGTLPVLGAILAGLEFSSSSSRWWLECLRGG